LMRSAGPPVTQEGLTGRNAWRSVAGQPRMQPSSGGLYATLWHMGRKGWLYWAAARHWFGFRRACAACVSYLPVSGPICKGARWAPPGGSNPPIPRVPGRRMELIKAVYHGSTLRPKSISNRRTI
jgi:hypothetical protein